MTHILAIDQGTTSRRAIVFDAAARRRHRAGGVAAAFPAVGLGRARPGAISGRRVAGTCRGAIERAGLTPPTSPPSASPTSARPRWSGIAPPASRSHRAIVWQDRRTAAPAPSSARRARADGHRAHRPAARPVFLRHQAQVAARPRRRRARAGRRGELAFGTVDSLLIWKLTGGQVHATDATNAARTLLYNIHDGAWDAEICALLDIPMAMLPEVRDCAADFGMTRADLFGRAIPILGVAGDQQAATVGQACFAPGMLKSTYGTGCFAVLNTGADLVASRNRLLTTIAYQLDGKPTYALEGSIFIAGAVVQWLRDGLKIIRERRETQALAEAADPARSSTWCPPSPASARPTGTPTAAARSSA